MVQAATSTIEDSIDKVKIVKIIINIALLLGLAIGCASANDRVDMKAFNAQAEKTSADAVSAPSMELAASYIPMYATFQQGKEPVDLSGDVKVRLVYKFSKGLLHRHHLGYLIYAPTTLQPKLEKLGFTPIKNIELKIVWKRHVSYPLSYENRRVVHNANFTAETLENALGTIKRYEDDYQSLMMSTISASDKKYLMTEPDCSLDSITSELSLTAKSDIIGEADRILYMSSK